LNDYELILLPLQPKTKSKKKLFDAITALRQRYILLLKMKKQKIIEITNQKIISDKRVNHVPQMSAQCVDPMPSFLHQLQLTIYNQNVLVFCHPSAIQKYQNTSSHFIFKAIQIGN
jgi:hypothetical protein